MTLEEGHQAPPCSPSPLIADRLLRLCAWSKGCLLFSTQRGCLFPTQGCAFQRALLFNCTWGLRQLALALGEWRGNRFSCFPMGPHDCLSHPSNLRQIWYHVTLVTPCLQPFWVEWTLAASPLTLWARAWPPGHAEVWGGGACMAPLYEPCSMPLNTVFYKELFFFQIT